MPKQVATTHTLMERAIVLYKRENSDVWQCRLKVTNQWQRTTTNERKLADAKQAALQLYHQAIARKQQNLPVVTRRFSHIAKIVIDMMEAHKREGRGRKSYDDYLIVINRYLLPFFKAKLITNINYDELDEFREWREREMGKMPTRSTLMTHNAAFNMILDEAERRGFLNQHTRPVLTSSMAGSKKYDRREAFERWEVNILLSKFDGWIDSKRKGKNTGLALLLRDYIEALLDTGARPGKELLDLKWADITYTDLFVKELEEFHTNDDGSIETDETGNPMRKTEISEELYLRVRGKTGERRLFARAATVNVLKRIARRNYPLTEFRPFWLKDFLESKRKTTDKVFVLKDGSGPTSFQHLFEDYLVYCDLLISKSSGKKRVFYSLRHTYATQMLEVNKTPIHTLAKQMGTSVLMIEKHYSHLAVMNAKDQLRGESIVALR
jgi:integrase